MDKVQKIKSFVCRAGRMSDTQKDALKTLLPKYEFSQAFSREAPTVLEIGFGMGHALLEMARFAPSKNFIGIEVHRPGVGSVLAALEAEGLLNVRVFMGDAVEALTHRFSDHSLDEVCIFFPDPWPKSRHHKRRLIQTPFVDLLAQKIKRGGAVHLATDWEPYALHMQEVFTAHPAFHGGVIARPPQRPHTKFEKKSEEAGRKVWDFQYRRQ